MSEEEKDLSSNVETESTQNGEEKKVEEDNKKTIGQKIADINPEEVGKKVDDVVGKISEKAKGLKIDKSTEEGKKKWKEWKGLIISAVVLILVGNFLNHGSLTDIFPSISAPELVKSAVPNGYDMTFEEAFNAVFDKCDWEYIGKNNGIPVVEFNGKAYDGTSFCIQFSVYDETTEVTYLGVDGQTATQDEIDYSMLIILSQAYDVISNTPAPTSAVSQNVPANSSKFVTSKNKVQETVPETFHDYSMDEDYDDDYYGPGDLEVDTEIEAPPVEELYIFDSEELFPELDGWFDQGYGTANNVSEAQQADVWYSEDTGLYITAVKLTNTWILTFSDGYNNVYTIYPTHDSSYNGFNGPMIQDFTVAGDLVDANNKRIGFIVADWHDGDYNELEINNIEEDDIISSYNITGTYYLQPADN